ncbi:Plasmodium exported protein, unknown function [Plasmodium malariae]|uniref:Uncharacterized protein n=1 Tax=Plasmodium malariae TaxID=5858 RepID=A0A1D3JID4_PLAMA|nr:Plasmodium exported protein, unknown function [Plasmodium malariae]SBT86109.1 Plasmodium exported protein, unknown function [Plasmodium malariae]
MMIQANKFFFFIKICAFSFLIWTYQNLYKKNTYGISYIKKIDLSNSLYVRVDRLLNEERGLHSPNGSIPLEKMSQKNFKVSSDTSNNNDNYEGRHRKLEGKSSKKEKNVSPSIIKPKKELDDTYNVKMVKALDNEYKEVNNLKCEFAQKFLRRILVITPVILSSIAALVVLMLTKDNILTGLSATLSLSIFVSIFILTVLVTYCKLLKNMYKGNNK